MLLKSETEQGENQFFFGLFIFDLFRPGVKSGSLLAHWDKRVSACFAVLIKNIIGQDKYSKLNKELDKISISNFIEFFSICLRCKWNYAKFTETLKLFFR